MRIRPRITPRNMKMWKNEILRLVLFLLVAGYVECQPWLRTRHPLCVSQFALANGACMHLPIYTVPPPPAQPGPPPAPGPPAPVAPGPNPEPPSPDPDDARSHHHHNRTGHDHDHNHNHDDRNHRRGGGHHDHDDHNHGHRRGHHENDGEHENGRHHHHHHHDHERRKVQEEPPAPGSPVEQECCHWLQQVDNDCVCNVLVNLPPFLSRPVHEYTVLVDHVCNVTFACPSRIRL